MNGDNSRIPNPSFFKDIGSRHVPIIACTIYHDAEISKYRHSFVFYASA